MKILDPNWIDKHPLDYELKKYVFLSAQQKFKKAIFHFELFSTLQEVELHLNNLYKLKYKKDEIDESRKIITGINVDLMELEYAYGDEADAFEEIFNIVDYAINKLENIHKEIRVKWRELTNKIIISEIPDNKPTKNKGLVFVVFEKTIKIYSYVKPEFTNKDWKSFKFNKIGEVKSDLRKIAEVISMTESKSNENRFWRIDIKHLNDKIPYENAILPIIKHNLFHRLKLN